MRGLALYASNYRRLFPRTVIASLFVGPCRAARLSHRTIVSSYCSARTAARNSPAFPSGVAQDVQRRNTSRVSSYGSQ